MGILRKNNGSAGFFCPGHCHYSMFSTIFGNQTIYYQQYQTQKLERSMKTYLYIFFLLAFFLASCNEELSSTKKNLSSGTQIKSVPKRTSKANQIVCLNDDSLTKNLPTRKFRVKGIIPTGNQRIPHYLKLKWMKKKKARKKQIVNKVNNKISQNHSKKIKKQIIQAQKKFISKIAFLKKKYAKNPKLFQKEAAREKRIFFKNYFLNLRVVTP